MGRIWQHVQDSGGAVIMRQYKRLKQLCKVEYLLYIIVKIPIPEFVASLVFQINFDFRSGLEGVKK